MSIGVSAREEINAQNGHDCCDGSDDGEIYV